MKVALMATARSVAPYLPHTLMIIDEIRTRCLLSWPDRPFVAVFFENDSEDATFEILDAWTVQRDNTVLLSEKHILRQFPLRTHRLAYARNKTLEYLRLIHPDCDRVVVMDLDDVCTELDVDNFFGFLVSDFEGISLKCANTKPHSDKFALRGLLKPDDTCVTTFVAEPDWRKCYYLDMHGIDSKFLDASKRSFKDDNPVLVESCFNHLGIYNGKLLLAPGNSCTYSGVMGVKEECEHVPLNKCMTERGSVQVEPKFIVRGIRHHQIYYGDMALPISSRRLPALSGIFSWGDDYLRADTEIPMPNGYFRSRWDPSATWVWVRMHSPGHRPESYDICQFSRDIVPLLKEPIVLLTGDGDISVPSELPPGVAETILSSPFVACWITQNCSSPGSYGGKLQAMPIGLDHKLENRRLLEEATPRPLSGRVVMDGHLAGKYSQTANDRHPTQLSGEAVYESIKLFGHVFAPARRMARDNLISMWKDADFVVCCDGNGMDTHRAWEVLCLNRIPIVYKTPMTESLYKGLPVVLSDDIVKTISDMPMLFEKARMLPESSSVNLATGLWLGRALGRGAPPIWKQGGAPTRPRLYDKISCAIVQRLRIQNPWGFSVALLVLVTAALLLCAIFFTRRKS